MSTSLNALAAHRDAVRHAAARRLAEASREREAAQAEHQRATASVELARIARTAIDHAAEISHGHVLPGATAACNAWFVQQRQRELVMQDTCQQAVTEWQTQHDAVTRSERAALRLAEWQQRLDAQARRQLARAEDDEADDFAPHRSAFLARGVA